MSLKGSELIRVDILPTPKGPYRYQHVLRTKHAEGFGAKNYKYFIQKLLKSTRLSSAETDNVLSSKRLPRIQLC